MTALILIKEGGLLEVLGCFSPVALVVNLPSFLIQLIFKPQIISNHRDKLAIRGFSSIILDSVSKVRIERIHVASVPRDLDGVAYRALNAARSSLIFLCNRRVEYFGDTVDYVTVLYR